MKSSVKIFVSIVIAAIFMFGFVTCDTANNPEPQPRQLTQ